jgi:hypothetical protein
MTPGFSIKIRLTDTVSGAMPEWRKNLTPERIAGRIGPAVQDLIEKHLAGLPPNKDGYPSTGFYEKFADNVRWVQTPSGVAVGILPAIINGRQVGIRQRVEGGPITPQVAYALAIPMSPVSYGHVPSDFPGLFLIKTAKGAYLAQAGETVTKGGDIGKGNKRRLGGNVIRRRNAALNFLFKLSSGVFQKPDPTVLPTDEEIFLVAGSALTGGLN